LVLFALGSVTAFGNTSYSFTGTFTQDDQVQLFPFTITDPVDFVTMDTLSWAGGTNLALQLIPAGGFDPVLSLFDGSGNYVTFNDDGTCGQVGMYEGNCYDAYISMALSAGSYTLALTESNNFPNTPTLADGFTQQGNGNFTTSLACTGPFLRHINLLE